MAIKTFSVGEVLTASDTNTYLANSGLVYVTSGTLSSTAKDFQGCFTSTFTNYRIVIDQVSFSGAADLYWRLLNGSTVINGANYSWAYAGYTSAAAADNSGAGGQTLAYTGLTNAVGVANVKIASCTLDVMNPQVAQRTFAVGQAVSYMTSYRTLNGSGQHDLATAYDGIQFLTNSAVTMTGNVTIYGYRKA
jgi:hypothetical protein